VLRLLRWFRNLLTVRIPGVVLRVLSALRSVLLRSLYAFKIFDEYDRAVSLTNIALMVCLFKLATMEAPDLEHLGILIAGLAAYQMKRASRSKVQVTEQRIAELEAATKRVPELEAELKRVSDRVVQVDNRVKGREGLR
jgi:hypothetical protein